MFSKYSIGTKKILASENSPQCFQFRMHEFQKSALVYNICNWSKLAK